MPGLSDCLHCPLRDSELVCPTITSEHPFCAKVDPESPSYKSSLAAAVVMIAKGETRAPVPVAPEPPATIGYPPLATQAWNAAKATVAFVASGFKVVDADEQARRLEICKTCKFFAAASERCSKCGCPLALKTYSMAERCPVGKW